MAGMLGAINELTVSYHPVAGSAVDLPVSNAVTAVKVTITNAVNLNEIVFIAI